MYALHKEMMRMKLQVALDTLSLEECIQLLEQTKGSVKIAEVGTPFIIEEGMVPVKEIHKTFPEIEVLADAKIMDAGEFEADKCFEAGASIVTVLGVSHDETIQGVVRSAKNHNGKVMVDMINVHDLATRTKEIDEMGVDYICVHTAFDVQQSGQDPLEELKIVNKVINHAKSAVAGGVKLETIQDIVNEGADIIVVGGAIEYAKTVLNELEHTLLSIDNKNAEQFVELVDQADEIFCAGAGRSGFQVKGFAMRLMHMGKKSYVVGETCTPNIKEDGILVICSGSGETKSLVNHAQKAQEVGAKLALITINPESTIGKMADVVIEISAPSPKSAKEGQIKSIQPMGSLFEQSEGLFMDIAIMMLMEKNHMDSDTMFGRHANME